MNENFKNDFKAKYSDADSFIIQELEKLDKELLLKNCKIRELESLLKKQSKQEVDLKEAAKQNIKKASEMYDKSLGSLKALHEKYQSLKKVHVKQQKEFKTVCIKEKELAYENTNLKVNNENLRKECIEKEYQIRSLTTIVDKNKTKLIELEQEKKEKSNLKEENEKLIKDLKELTNLANRIFDENKRLKNIMLNLK